MSKYILGIICVFVPAAIGVYYISTKNNNNDYDEDTKDFIANIDGMVKSGRITSEEGRKKIADYLNIKPNNQKGGKMLTKKSKSNMRTKSKMQSKYKYKNI